MSESEGRVPHLLDDDAGADDASAMLRSALRGARADVPDAARMEALSASIAGAIGGGGGGGGSGSGGGGGAMGATKIALGGAAVVAAIGVAFLATSGGGGAVEAKPDADLKASTSTSTSASAAGTDAGTEAVLDVHSLPAAPTVDAARAVSSAASVAKPDEMGMLKQAQEALAGSPAEALAKCEEHAKAYPGGTLAEEREVIAVDALIRLGRRSEAEARATRFRAAHPGSAYVRRLDTLLGREP